MKNNRGNLQFIEDTVDNLLRLCEEYHISQSVVARWIGVTQQAVNLRYKVLHKSANHRPINTLKVNRG